MVEVFCGEGFVEKLLVLSQLVEDWELIGSEDLWRCVTTPVWPGLGCWISKGSIRQWKAGRQGVPS